jgi:hypothetical protein
MTHSLRRFTTANSLFGLLAAAIAMTVMTPGRAEAHHLCGNTGSPFGAFNLQTYEAADYRNAYARTMDLAGYNQLFPDRPTFSLPALETGGRGAGSGQLTGGYIPPVLLKSIAWIESGWAQASYDPPVQYGQVGPVLSSHDCGYGLMQVTSGMQNVSGVPTLDQAMIGGHYAFNIARGARILAEKWNAAPEVRPLVGGRNTRIIEDWYYALWGYNGFAFKNHPLNPDYAYPRPMYDCSSSRTLPYQELIMGCAANPPSRGGARLWNPQPVHLPNLSDPAFYNHLKLENWSPCSQSLQCASMDMPTPNPWNVDPTVPALSRSQVFGDPSVALSHGNLSFVAPSGTQSPNQVMAIGNGGSGVLAWRLQASAPWIHLSRIQGVSLGADLGYTHQLVAVRADASSLLPGTHTAHITVESLWGAAPATITVTVQTGDGALLHTPDGAIWVFQGGLKRHIPDPATFEANGHSWNKVISVPAEWAAGVPTGHPIPSVLATGRLLKPAGNQVPIYVMDAGAKRHITSMNTFWGCAYGGDAIDTVSASTANSIPNGPPLNGHPCPRPSFPNGTLLKGSDGKLWVVQFNARKWVLSPGVASDCGYRAGNINDLGDSINGQIAISPNLSGCTADGSLLWTEDGRISVWRFGRLRHIPDPITFELSGFAAGNVAPVGARSFPAGEPLMNLAMTGILFRPPGANVPIYVLDGGVKRHITSPNVIDGCGYPWPAISTISAAIVNGIPNGPPLQGAPCPTILFPFGTLLQGADGAVWVTLGQGRKWVSSFNAFIACGYQVGKINPVAGTVLAGVFAGPPVTGCGTNTPVATRDGKVYIVVSGWKRHVPTPATADVIGVSWANVVPIPDGWLPTAKPLLDVAATGRLVRPPGDNVPIYVMDAGAKRHITSPAALAACGYGWDAVSVLPATTVAGFPNGTALSGAPCPQPTFANGTLLVGSDGKVWTMQSGQRRWITDSSVFIACGYRGLDIDRIADSIIAALPQGANLSAPPCP